MKKKCDEQKRSTSMTSAEISNCTAEVRSRQCKKTLKSLARKHAQPQVVLSQNNGNIILEEEKKNSRQMGRVYK